jgi:glycosyltransferase involved in cell wall biosynthesis
VNGYLVREPSAKSYAGYISELLTDPDQLSRFSRSARASAERYSIAHASGQWTRILESKRQAA